ncbi:hypothetical protein ED733_003201 [Metarhizium rileyi]|uniref:Uncharacterized protein n=1 Tax=Metarhizium rileyi (strain RCEF 4871) TaxID=1649241 RepID=A0A5C6GAW6_METRR|nr:hypothetical protein ED733_003201 [Metarhizium rileyi]
MERLDQCNVQNCGLCTFKFEDNEVIFAGNLVSSEVQEARHNPNWLYSDELAVAFHKLCYGYAGGVSPQLRAITRYDFSPSQESMANARHFGPSILSQLNAELNALNPKMPLELQKYIADYLTPYYHIAITVASSRLKPKPKPTRVSLSSDIWAHSVTFHGKLYISNLSSEKNNDSKLIYSAASSRPADILYIARDPWGVKEVVVALRGDAVERVEEADTWWEAISISPNLGYMKGDNDGLKLRNLEFEANDGNTRIVWTTPQSLQQNIRVIRSRDDSSEIRFTPFVINGANVSGYSTAVSGDTLALQAHESKQTSLSSSETH